MRNNGPTPAQTTKKKIMWTSRPERKRITTSLSVPGEENMGIRVEPQMTKEDRTTSMGFKKKEPNKVRSKANALGPDRTVQSEHHSEPQEATQLIK